MLYTIETDALPINLMRIAGEVGVPLGAGQGGRLGAMACTGKVAAGKVAAELREYGYVAWVTRGTGG